MGDIPTTTPSVPGQYDEYRKPQESGTLDSLRHGLGTAASFVMPVGGSFVEDLISDGAKVNEKDPSWEEVITMVVIPGRPASIRNAAEIWGVIFKRIENAAQLLDDGIKDLKTWEGAAGDAYRANLTAQLTKLRGLVDKHKTIVTSLNKAAQELDTAIGQIPIPQDMAHEVSAAQVNFKDTGKISNGFLSGSIFDKLLPIYSNKWVDELQEAFTPDWATNTLRDWISGEDDKAKAAYRTLAGQHVSTMDGMPDALLPSDINNPNIPTVTPTPTNPTGKPPSIPTTKPPGAIDPKTTADPFKTSQLPTTGDPNADLPNSNLPDSTTPSDSWSDPSSSTDFPGASSSLPGTGLAGAGGSGLAGAGLGGASGLGAGGLGGGGLGGGLPGSGSGLGAGAGLGGTGATGAGLGGAGMAGAGGAGRGAGTGAGRTGMAGMGGMGAGGGHGAGGGDGDEHSTWLTEDEDVWGSDTGAAPPVLGV